MSGHINHITDNKDIDLNPAQELIDVYNDVDLLQQKNAQKLLEESEALHGKIAEYSSNRRKILRLIKDGENNKDLIDPSKNPELQEIFDFIEANDTDHQLDLSKYNDPMDKLMAIQEFFSSETTSMQSEASMKFTKFHLQLLTNTELVRVMNDVVSSQARFISGLLQKTINR